MDSLADIAAEGDRTPAVDLTAWTLGYLAGYDSGAAAARQLDADALAVTVAELDRSTWVQRGEEIRQQRIAAELAAGAARATPVRQADGWPPVTIPGTGKPEQLAGFSEQDCQCPRDLIDPRRYPHPLKWWEPREPGQHVTGFDTDGTLRHCPTPPWNRCTVAQCPDHRPGEHLWRWHGGAWHPVTHDGAPLAREAVSV